MAEPTEFANPTGIKWDGYVGEVQYGGGDNNMVVIFYTHAAHNPQKSAQEGRPIFDDQVYVRVAPPGERLNVVVRPASEDDRRRWPMQWQQYQQNKPQQQTGTPIDLLYPESPSVPAMLRAINIQTIEHLANLSGNAIDNIGMGGQRYVNDAKRYMDTATKGAGATASRQQIEHLESENRVLKQQLDQLKAVVVGLEQRTAAAPNLAAVQQMLASVMQVPQQMPTIDGQSQVIANNHPTRQLADQQVQAPMRKRSRAG